METLRHERCMQTSEPDAAHERCMQTSEPDAAIKEDIRANHSHKRRHQMKGSKEGRGTVEQAGEARAEGRKRRG